jgi:tetratricopeptide (TPR) repeat protein
MSSPWAAEEYARKHSAEASTSVRRKSSTSLPVSRRNVTGETEKVIETYELWREVYPRDWIPANNVANEYVRVGQLDKAIEASQSAMRLNRFRFPYLTLAQAYRRSGRFARSESDLRKIIADKRDNTSTHNNLFEIAFPKATRPRWSGRSVGHAEIRRVTDTFFC